MSTQVKMVDGELVIVGPGFEEGEIQIIDPRKTRGEQGIMDMLRKRSGSGVLGPGITPGLGRELKGNVSIGQSIHDTDISEAMKKPRSVERRRVRSRILDMLDKGEIPTRDMFLSDEEYRYFLKQYNSIKEFISRSPESLKEIAGKRLRNFEAEIEAAKEGGIRSDRVFDREAKGYRHPEDLVVEKMLNEEYTADRLQQLKDEYEWSPSAGPETRGDYDYFPEYMYKELPKYANLNRKNIYIPPTPDPARQYNQGGRVGYQSGGITESRVLPPEYIEALGKTYAADLTKQAGIPSITTATAQQPGETAQQWQQRQAQAQQYGITKAGMAELAPQVAAQDPYQAAAYAQAVDPTTGLGAYQPYLADAKTAATAATALTGTGAGTGAGSIQSYMSPYQQQVIDATMADYDAQAAKSRLGLGAQAVAGGAYGAGRHGIAEAEFDALSNRGRAAQLANLRSTGFQQAAQRRQQDLQNQMGLTNLQTGLGQTAQDFGRAQIAGLGTLGATQQAQNQAVLDAQRQFATMAVQEPVNRMNMLGTGVMGLMGGMSPYRTEIGEAPATPQSSPLATALGVGLTGADIYSRLFAGKRN